MPFPNFIIAGPPKTGSTSLYSWLSDHPDCFASSVKETNYFYDISVESNQDANYVTHGMEKYEQFFIGNSNQSVIFESSPGYAYCNTAIEGIGQLPQIPKILLVYRKPAGRLFSEYRFQKYKLKNFEGSLADYAAWNGQQFSGKYFERGLISNHINKWIGAFGEKVKVIHFDQLIENSRATMIDLAKWLEIDHRFFERYHFETKNETFGLRNRSLHLRALKIASYVPKWIRNTVTPLYYIFNKTSIPETSEEDLETLELLKVAYEDQTFESIG